MRRLLSVLGLTVLTSGCIGPIPPLPEGSADTGARDLGVILDALIDTDAVVEPDADIGPEYLGAIDSISIDGVASGWAINPRDPGETVWVRLILDEGTERAAVLGTFPADQPQLGANQNAPDGPHRFEIALHDAALDGRSHSLSVIALGVDADSKTPLAGSPLPFQAGLNTSPPIELNPPADQYPPQGALDGVTADGLAFGWAFDLDVSDRPLQVHLYVDDSPYDGGRYIGSVETDQARPDVVAAWDHPGLHGFALQLPESLLDQSRPLYAYVFNVGHPGNVLLDGAPVHFGGFNDGDGTRFDN